jgi:hypothetical protein
MDKDTDGGRGKDEDVGLHDLLCAVDEMRAELVAELRALRDAIPIIIVAPRNPPRPGPLTPASPLPLLPGFDVQLVSLDQIAAILRRKKRGLERHKKTMPKPRDPGGRGRVALWSWPEVRPHLEAKFGMALPELFPDWHPPTQEEPS